MWAGRKIRDDVGGITLLKFTHYIFLNCWLLISGYGTLQYFKNSAHRGLFIRYHSEEVLKVLGIFPPIFQNMKVYLLQTAVLQISQSASLHH